MLVTKSDGSREPVQFDKITERLRPLTEGLDGAWVDPVKVAQKVVEGVHDGVTTQELDELAAETSAYLTTQHPDYGLLAGRIAVTRLHKRTSPSFAETVRAMHAFVHPQVGEQSPLVSDELLAFVEAHAAELDAAMDYSRDLSYDFFAFKTLERSYLTKMGDDVVERPQHMLMRVAAAMHDGDVAATIESYDLMSRGYFTHASPTLFNAGTRRQQCSSCFLVAMSDDSIEGIYDTLKHCAMISKNAGGIGMHCHNIRASHSYIRGTNGSSNGLVPMLRVFNDSARFVTQGGGKRKGSIACYLEPWHADIFEWLDLKKNHGNELQRARDLFYGLWVPDLFMERVRANGQWSLFCPNEAPGLADVHSAEFVALYERYEREGRARRAVRAQELWSAIVDAQVETGTPYILYKDACNSKSNQQHLGTIKSSNLCCEVIQYSSPEETAVCNLASIALPKFVTPEGAFDFDMLYRVTKVVTRNLNKVIDMNFYPVPEARTSNMRHRPIGIGVQGLADALMLMRLPFESDAAAVLNRDIFETMYFGAMEASMELAQQLGPHESYPGSPVSRGVFQFDMWGVQPSTRWDWAALKAAVAEHGVRNSLLLAPMPTASTAQILGNNESIEPFTSNLYSRRVMAGEFTVVNKHLLRDLIALGLWTPELRNQIIANGGSVQGLAEVPADVRELYKTVWEVRQKVLIDMAADRAAFICQSQSFNVHLADPTYAKMSSMHFYAWRKGLKTGMYYLRSRPKADAIQFTVDQAAVAARRAAAASQDEENAEENALVRQDSLAATALPQKMGRASASASALASAAAPAAASSWEAPLRKVAPGEEPEDEEVCLTCSA